MWPGFDSRTRRQMWVEFVVGSRPCSERFFSGYSGYSGFPLSSKTNISKFQLTLKSPERDEPIKYVFIYLFICYILVANVEFRICLCKVRMSSFATPF